MSIRAQPARKSRWKRAKLPLGALRRAGHRRGGRGRGVVGLPPTLIARTHVEFYARIEEEDVSAPAWKEEQAAKNAAQEENHQKGETQ